MKIIGFIAALMLSTSAFGYTFTSTVLATEQYRNQNKNYNKSYNKHQNKMYKRKYNIYRTHKQKDGYYIGDMGGLDNNDDELSNLMHTRRAKDNDELGKLMFNKLNPDCLVFEDNELKVKCKDKH